MKEIKINSASLGILINFYNENNNAFVPPLSSQVKSIAEYAQKLKDKAIIFEAWENNELIGLAAAYFNNYKTRIGFITSVVVSQKYQKRGIAKMLLEKAIDFAKENGFEKIQLEVNKKNARAIDLYEKFGFTEKTKEFIMLELNIVGGDN